MRRFGILAVALALALLPAMAEAQTGTISGNVTDAGTGAGLNVGVQVYSWNGVGIASTTAIAGSGAYAIANLVPGIYFARTFKLSATSNYIDEAYSDIVCAPTCSPTTTTPIVVVSGGTTTVNFGLSLGGAVSGVVTDAVLAPISGISVLLWFSPNVNNQVNAFSTTTNASGVWTINGLPAGTYYSYTNVPQLFGTYVNKAYNNIPCTPSCPSPTSNTPIIVTGTATTTGIDYALSPSAGGSTGSITGTVTVEGTATPVQSDVNIFNSSGALVTTALSNSLTGVYTVAGLPAGTYYARTAVGAGTNLIDEAYGNVPCVPCPTITTTTPITVGTSTTPNINFALVLGASITGIVSDQTTFAVLPNVGVQVYNSTGIAVKFRSSDSTGLYSVVGLPPGTYYARSFVPGNIDFLDEAWNNIPCTPCPTITTTMAITVSGTSTTAGINFALAGGGTISGTVTDQRTGAPGPSVNVQIFSSTGALVKSASADINGNYSVVGLPTGAHYARTGFSSNYVTKLYNNIVCPNSACAVTTGAPIGVSAGGTVAGINFALTPAGGADVMVTFGAPYGLWRYGSDNKWTSIHPASPLSTATGDFDGNGHDDLAVNFGAPYGVYAWMNHATWQFIHPASPSVMVAADLDNNGNDDLIMVFTGYGVWRWVNTGAFNQIHGGDANKLAVGDLDGPGPDDLILDFPGYGLWALMNNATFTSLHALNAATLTVADINGNGRDDVVVGFTGYGLYVLRDNTTWGVLHAATPLLTAAGRLDTSAAEDLVVDFGAPYGLWTFRNNATWASLHPASAQSVTMADRTGNGVDEMIVDFGAPYGVYMLSNLNTATGWSSLHPADPVGINAGRFK